MSRVGAYVATDLIGTTGFPTREHSTAYLAAVILWMLFDFAAAAALFKATVSSFDRCLGRIPENGQPAPRRSP